MKIRIAFLLMMLLLSTISFASVKLSISKSQVNIGDQIDLLLVVEGNSSELFIPEIKSEFADIFRVRFSEIKKTSDTEGQILYKIVPMQVGQFSNIFDKSNIEHIPDFTITVTSLLTDNVTDISDIKGVIDWAPEKSFMAKYICIVCGFIGIALLVVYIKYRKPKAKIIHIETALKAYATLKSNQVEDVTSYFLQLAVIVRQFLAETAKTDYTDATTEEILETVADDQLFQLASRLLLKADRIKFAGEQVEQEELDRAIVEVDQLVLIENGVAD